MEFQTCTDREFPCIACDLIGTPLFTRLSGTLRFVFCRSRRFDLFANNALRKALKTLGWNDYSRTYQRAVIVDLTELEELSEGGFAALMQMDQPKADGNAAVFFAQLKSPEIQKINKCVAVHTSYTEAITALENALRSRADKFDGEPHGSGFRTGFWSRS